MKPKMPKSPLFSIHRRQIHLFFIIFMSVGATISGMMMILYQSETKLRLSQLKMQEEYSVDLQSHSVSNILESLIGDLRFLSNQSSLGRYLNDGAPSHLDDIAAEYLNLSASKNFYDQIRFLDTEGLEIVRVNYHQGTPARTPQSGLQSKVDRYYFYDCYRLGKDEVFISPFDLNIEHGEIEQPLKPMIRLGTPVFDSRDRKRGIVLLNYLGSNLLNRLSDLEQVSEGTTMLLNAEGYWLLNPDTALEWGFMFDDRTRSFAHAYPGIWDRVQRQDSGQILSPDGLFTFKTIYPLLQDSAGSGAADARKTGQRDYRWHIVSFTPREVLDHFSMLLKTRLFSLGAGLFLIIATGSWFIAYAVTRKKIAQDQLKIMALYDELTGLPNRRLFFERLNTLIKQGRRYDTHFGLLYIDLDGFKKINDNLGHTAGDELLSEVAARMDRCVRESDTVARLGGDEFGVILPTMSTREGAETVAGKIIYLLSEPIMISQGEVRIGASIGISLFPEHSENGDELLRQADTAMYRSKRTGKGRFSLYSGDFEEAGSAHET